MQKKQSRKQKKKNSNKHVENHSVLRGLGYGLLQLKVSSYLFYAIVIVGMWQTLFYSGHITTNVLSLNWLVAALTLGTVCAFIYWLIVKMLNMLGWLLSDLPKNTIGEATKWKK